MLTLFLPFTLLASNARGGKVRELKKMPGLKRVIPGGEHLSAACRVWHSVPLAVWAFPFSFFFLTASLFLSLAADAGFHGEQFQNAHISTGGDGGKGMSHRRSQAAQTEEMEERRGGNAKRSASPRWRPPVSDAPRVGERETLNFDLPTKQSRKGATAGELTLR